METGPGLSGSSQLFQSHQIQKLITAATPLGLPVALTQYMQSGKQDQPPTGMFAYSSLCHNEVWWLPVFWSEGFHVPQQCKPARLSWLLGWLPNHCQCPPSQQRRASWRQTLVTIMPRDACSPGPPPDLLCLNPQEQLCFSEASCVCLSLLCPEHGPSPSTPAASSVRAHSVSCINFHLSWTQMEDFCKF